MQMADVSIDSAIHDTTVLLSNRGDAMLILTISFALAGLWVWKVVIPERTARREQDTLREAARLETEKLHSETLAKQADTIAAMGQVTATIHDTTTHTHDDISVMLQVFEIQMECIDRIAQHCKCNEVRDSLIEIRGIVKMAMSRHTRDTSQQMRSTIQH